VAGVSGGERKSKWKRDGPLPLEWLWLLTSAHCNNLHCCFVAHDWIVTLIPLISIWLACNARFYAFWCFFRGIRQGLAEQGIYHSPIYKEWYYFTTTSLFVIEQWLWYIWFRYDWLVTQDLRMLVLFQRYQTRIGGARNLSLSNLQGIVLFHDYFVVRDWTVTLIPLISIWLACSSRVTHVGVVSEVSDKDWRSKELSSANPQGIVLSHDYFVAHDWTVTLIHLISIWLACNSRFTHVGVVSEVSDKDWRSKELSSANP